MREKSTAEQLFTCFDHSLRAGVAAHQGTLQARLSTGAQDRKQLYRHTDKGVRLFPSHHCTKLPVAESRAQFQRPGAEPLDGLADQLPKSVGPGKRKTDHRDTSRKNQLSQPGHEELHRVPTVPFGIKHPFRRPGRARGCVGQDTLDLRLGAKQQARCVPGQILIGGKG